MKPPTYCNHFELRELDGCVQLDLLYEADVELAATPIMSVVMPDAVASTLVRALAMHGIHGGSGAAPA